MYSIESKHEIAYHSLRNMLFDLIDDIEANDEFKEEQILKDIIIELRIALGIVSINLISSKISLYSDDFKHTPLKKDTNTR